MDSQVQPVSLSRLSGKGFYLLRLVDNGGQGVYEQKILVQ
ncbi:MAG: hypothetical protein EOO12_13560 [Chitinophagaceae bacterium]|nr:MAG: hypothetical protein EOO12_13560 [Chitinophagaceae bacterium]